MIEFSSGMGALISSDSGLAFFPGPLDPSIRDEVERALAENDSMFRRLAAAIVSRDFVFPDFVAVSLADRRAFLYGRIQIHNGSSTITNDASTWVEHPLQEGEVTAGELSAPTDFRMTKGIAPAGGIRFVVGAQTERPPASGMDPVTDQLTPAVAEVEPPTHPTEPLMNPFKSDLAQVPRVVAGMPDPNAPSGGGEPTASFSVSRQPEEPVVPRVDPVASDGDPTRDESELGPPPLPAARNEPIVAQEKGTLMGLLCTCGTGNPPGRPRCRTCDLPLNRPEVSMGRVPKPHLGSLVINGQQQPISKPVLFGRGSQGSDPIDGEAPERISFDDQRISRKHALVKPIDWYVYITDLGSTSGTTVEPPGGRPPVRLQPNVPMLLEPGSVIVLGQAAHVAYED